MDCRHVHYVGFRVRGYQGQVMAFVHPKHDEPDRPSGRLPQVARSDKSRLKPGWQSLAEAVIEIALRDALGDYARASTKLVTQKSTQDAQAFFLGEDCEPWIGIANADRDRIEAVRRMIRDGERVAV